MTRHVPAVALAVLALSFTPARADIWWAAEFPPAGQSVEGLPLSALDSTWAAASVLREDMFPPEARKKGESVADHDGCLTATMDLDGDRRPEKAVVGVYRDRAGATGRFLLILAKDGRGHLRKKALFVEPGAPGFSVLYQHDKDLAWAFCMECDTSCGVVLKRGALELECEEE